MIGLGSNRLTIARRGGMSVTQAGRGGMEWLAGGRVPDWITPYSAQATAALKAQFPTQWPTIRDYGFAHPEIVGYMNAYAPEDAKIAYSLVEGIGTRWIKTTNGARINPSLNTAADTEYEVMVMPTSMAQETSFIGNRSANNLIQFYGSQFRIVPNGSWTTASGVTVVANGIYTAKLTKDGFWTNGEKRLTLSATIGTGQPIWIFQACNGSSYHASPLVGGISYAKIYSSVGNREMYPFIRKINGVDVCGMIDVLSGTFYQNQGSGSFTISDSPS